LANKPILCVDFDGVIHSYASGWQGATVIPDQPVTGALGWLWKASEWWDVQIYSSRTKEPGGIEAMKEWLAKHAVMEFPISLRERFMETIGFPEQKPPAVLTIDDRAITFEGVWADLDPRALLDFKPWNKRPIGATGAFPEGRISEDDEGELRLGVTREGEVIKLAFGKPVAWLGFPPETAIELGKMLIKRAGAKKIEVSF